MASPWQLRLPARQRPDREGVRRDLSLATTASSGEASTTEWSDAAKRLSTTSTHPHDVRSGVGSARLLSNDIPAHDSGLALVGEPALPGDLIAAALPRLNNPTLGRLRELLELDPIPFFGTSRSSFVSLPVLASQPPLSRLLRNAALAWSRKRPAQARGPFVLARLRSCAGRSRLFEAEHEWDENACLCRVRRSGLRLVRQWS